MDYSIQDSPDVLSGTIIFSAQGKAKVLCKDTEIFCDLDVRLTTATQTRPVVGDNVLLRCVDGDRWLVTDCVPRRNKLSRPEPGSPHIESVIAANIDLAVLVVSVKNPPLRQKLIDRFLIATEKEAVAAALCVNKIDLVSGYKREKLLERISPYEKLGIPIRICSAKTGEGISGLTELLRHKVGVLAGHSGVGKSSLINALNPEYELRTQEPGKQSRKGRHTTSAAMLYRVGNEIKIIDSPGFREFGMRDIRAGELQSYFSEFREFAAECKFNDCLHVKEMECNVKRAVQTGKILKARYDSYLRIIRDIDPRLSGAEDTVCAGDDACGSFSCFQCGQSIGNEGSGTRHRNHCPNCLWSLHLDIVPGDRSASCGGKMEPVAVWVRYKGEWAVIHRCRDCGMFSSNRIAADDNEMLLMSLAVKPLAAPPFPLHKLRKSE